MNTILIFFLSAQILVKSDEKYLFKKKNKVWRAETLDVTPSAVWRELTARMNKGRMNEGRMNKGRMNKGRTKTRKWMRTDVPITE